MQIVKKSNQQLSGMCQYITEVTTIVIRYEVSHGVRGCGEGTSCIINDGKTMCVPATS